MHSVNLGSSAPRISNARVHRDPSPGSDPVSTSREAVATRLTLSQEIHCNISYVDTVAISISTSVLFNYPFPSFARLPASLTISLALFAAPVSKWHGRSSITNQTDGRTVFDIGLSYYIKAEFGKRWIIYLLNFYLYFPFNRNN